jgi:hypothetical protein
MTPDMDNILAIQRCLMEINMQLIELQTLGCSLKLTTIREKNTSYIEITYPEGVRK